MALTINTNLSSIVAQKNLGKATVDLNKAIERMTTGYKINHAADNAAGHSIAKNWETKLSSLDVAADNAATAADMLATLEDNSSLITSHLQRVRDLTEQASNGTYGLDSLKSIEAEIAARLEEIIRISSNAEFNGLHLMDSSLSSGVSAQVGLDSSDNSIIDLDADLFTDSSLKGLFDNLTVSGATKTIAELINAGNGGAAIAAANYNTEAGIRAIASACAGLQYKSSAFSKGGDAKDMLAYLDAAISKISDKTTKIGAAQNRIESAIESIGVQSENITSSLSTLRDADVAEESSNYIKSQILQQAAATLLSTANQSPSIALNLI